MCPSFEEGFFFLLEAVVFVEAGTTVVSDAWDGGFFFNVACGSVASSKASKPFAFEAWAAVLDAQDSGFFVETARCSEASGWASNPFAFSSDDFEWGKGVVAGAIVFCARVASISMVAVPAGVFE